MNFECSRTCTRRELCRFQAIFGRLGPVVVNSHTVKIKVEYRDPDALRAAIELLGGRWLGHGSHPLYQRAESGLGFNLPGWRYPLVLGAGGELAYDDFGGSWGNTADLEKLKGAYTLGVAANAAVAQGWTCERTEGGLLIHHPSGGTMTVTPNGVIDANGFMGQGCHSAIMSLGLPALESVAKPEYSQVAASVQQSR